LTTERLISHVSLCGQVFVMQENHEILVPLTAKNRLAYQFHKMAALGIQDA